MSGGKESHFHHLSGGKERPPDRYERTFTTWITDYNIALAIQYEKYCFFQLSENTPSLPVGKVCKCRV